MIYDYIKMSGKISDIIFSYYDLESEIKNMITINIFKDSNTTISYKFSNNNLLIDNNYLIQLKKTIINYSGNINIIQILQDIKMNEIVINKVKYFLYYLGFQQDKTHILSQILIEYMIGQSLNETHDIEFYVNKTVYKNIINLYIFKIIEHIINIVKSINNVFIDYIINNKQPIIFSPNKLLDKDLNFIKEYYTKILISPYVKQINGTTTLKQTLIFQNFHYLLEEQNSELKYNYEEAFNILADIDILNNEYIFNATINNNDVINSIKNFYKTISLLNANIN